MNADSDSSQSSYRERLLEHLFIGDLLRELWLAGTTDVEVLKSEVDGAGYDLVLEANGFVRHVQLKTSRLGAKRAGVDIQLKLAHKPGGCVIWLFFDPVTLKFSSYLWFGGVPGRPLPPISHLRVVRHTKGNSKGFKADRPSLRQVPKRQFERLDSISEVVKRLFGSGVLSRSAR